MRVSIITPTFNHHAWIDECIDSVQAQSYEDWEMLVVDDASTDGTAELVAARQDPRIRVLYQAHHGIAGLAETYNHALREASGDLVAILEGDDTWPPDKLAVQVPDFRDPSVVLSAGRFTVTRGPETLGTFPLEMPPLDAGQNDPVGRAARWMLHPHGLTFAFPVTVVMRRSALLAVGGFTQPAGLPVADYPTLLEMSRQGAWRFHDHVLGRWRRHGESTTLSRAPVILQGCHRVAADFAEAHGASLPVSIDEWKELNQAWAYLQVNRLVSLGRILAREGRSHEARRCFERARELPHGRRDRVALPLARALMSVGLSPDWAFRFTGTAGARQGDAEAAGDSLVNLETGVEDIVWHPLQPLARD